MHYISALPVFTREITFNFLSLTAKNDLVSASVVGDMGKGFPSLTTRTGAMTESNYFSGKFICSTRLAIESNYILFILPVTDLVVPLVLMITLLVGNAIIVWILLRLKRREKLRCSTATQPTNV